MKIRYVYGFLKGVDVESNFVPLVGDYVSLNGCVGVPFYIQARTLKVVNRTYIYRDNSVTVYLMKDDSKVFT